MIKTDQKLIIDELIIVTLKKTPNKLSEQSSLTQSRTSRITKRVLNVPKEQRIAIGKVSVKNSKTHSNEKKKKVIFLSAVLRNNIF